MKSVQDPPPSGQRDVARFLAAHETCDAGVRLLREPGSTSSRAAIACTGCGEQVAYELGDPGLSQIAGTAGAGVGPRRSRRRPTRAQVERWLPAPAALPWWVPNAYIVAVIAVGLGLAVFGLVGTGRDDRALFGDAGGGGDTSDAPVASPPPVAAAGAAAAPAARPEPAEPPRPEPAASGLSRVELMNLFEIGAPEGWLGGTRDGAIFFAEPGGDALVRVFLEPGDRGPGTLAREARRFVGGEHPGARIGRQGRILVGGQPAAVFVARFAGGSERAVLLSEGGYEYLLLARVEAGASQRHRALAAAALHSFTAL